MNIRKSVERFFEVWSEIVVSHRWLVLILTIVITAAIAPQIRKGWLDVSLESFLPVNDPAIVEYNQFRRDFEFMPGNSLAIKMPDEIFTLKNLARLKALHEDLERQVPYAKEVISLYNVRYSRGEGDTLLIDELGEVWPKTEAEIPAFKKLVLSNPNYAGSLVSRDGKVAVIAIQPDVYSSQGRNQDAAVDVDALSAGFDDSGFDANGFDDSNLSDAGFDQDDSVAVKSGNSAETQQLEFLKPEEEEAFAKKVFAVIAAHSSDDFYVYAIGGPTMNYQMAQDYTTSTERSVSLGLTFIIILLAILFRRFSGVFMPLLVVALALIMTIALWPTLGYAFNSNTQLIPTFILAVGIADAVHILTIFYRYYDNGMSKHDAIIRSMQETSVAVLMTTLTTALGLLSFLSSDMVPIRTIGVFGSIGVMMALLYTLTLLPSLLAVLPIKQKQHQGAEKTNFVLARIDTMINACGRIGVVYAKPVVALTCVLVALSLYGVSKVKFEHDPVRWYGEDTDQRKGVDLMDAKMDGSLDAQLLLKFGEENSLHRVEVLKAIEEIEDVIRTHEYENTKARRVVSILSVVKETHQSLNRNDPAFYKIPETRQAVAQEMILFENSGSDDIYDFTNTKFSTARIDFFVPAGDVITYRGYLRQLRAKISAVLAKHQLHNVQIVTTGLLGIFSETTYTMLKGTVKSYGLAFLLVAATMILLMGDLRRGLLAFSPNVTPILMTLGVMGLVGINLNSFTSLIGCIVIGISVDDTIHFMHHFRRFAEQTDNVREVVRKTLDTCGRAIVFTSIVLIGGFIVHVTGIMTVNKEFGILLSLAIFIALFANLILAPALMTVFWQYESRLQMAYRKARAR